MSADPLEPLDPELDALLDSERNAEAPAEVLGRIWSRVAAVPAAGIGGSGGTAPRNGWLASHAASVAAAAFVAGGAAGAVTYAALEKPQPARVVYVERPAAPAPSVETPAPEKASPSPAPSAVVAPPPTPQTAPSVSTSLAAERALVDRARGELASGNATHALVLLEEHVHRFPKAQLAEEREALVIQSLVALGRYDEARAAAARFRAASPGSLFLPAIEASLGSIP